MEKTVCIFCSSSTKIPELYHKEAAELTRLLIQNKYSVKYGAGSVGLMGTVANTALENGGYITGIIPEFMVKMEWANKNISQLVIVEDMHERKRKMIENVDAVIALAGGIGTLDELVEVITLKQLGQFTKPVIILNTNNFYDNFLAQLEKMVEEGFMHLNHKQFWFTTNSVIKVINALNVLKETDNSVIRSAQV